MPAFPFDVFAFSGHLIRITGLMGHLDPNPDNHLAGGSKPRFKLNEHGRAMFAATQPLKVFLSRKMRDDCRNAAADWQRSGEAPDYAVRLWNEIIKAAHLPIRIRDYQDKRHLVSTYAFVAAPLWWSAAFELMLISDEACNLVGHVDDDTRPPYFDIITNRIKKTRSAERNSSVDIAGIPMAPGRKQLATLCQSADRNVVCVQPKGRVSKVGCSLRNITRNLALVGPVGEVRCNWQQLDGKVTTKPSDSLNILLIPYPYQINAADFQPHGGNGDDPWGSFKLRQNWLPQSEQEKAAFCDDICSIVETAMQEVANVNAIVLPEYSISYDLFELLVSRLSNLSDNRIEFLVAGSSSNCDNEAGNCVLTAIWENVIQAADPDRVEGPVRIISQRKHHRWLLDEKQIRAYRLSSVLPPYTQWWEAHHVGIRELNFFQFRKSAVVASLICEDLARNDPCHDILRSVAPNLIISVLMDGPQTATRWPSRYAGSLADDPGSTIITFTSYGLIERSNSVRFNKPDNHAIAMVRDDTGITAEIPLETGAAASIVTLASKTANDYTMDGRSTTNATNWHFVNHAPVHVKAGFGFLNTKNMRFQTG